MKGSRAISRADESHARGPSSHSTARDAATPTCHATCRSTASTGTPWTLPDEESFWTTVISNGSRAQVSLQSSTCAVAFKRRLVTHITWVYASRHAALHQECMGDPVRIALRTDSFPPMGCLSLRKVRCVSVLQQGQGRSACLFNRRQACMIARPGIKQDTRRPLLRLFQHRQHQQALHPSLALPPLAQLITLDLEISDTRASKPSRCSKCPSRGCVGAATDLTQSTHGGARQRVLSDHPQIHLRPRNHRQGAVRHLEGQGVRQTGQALHHAHEAVFPVRKQVMGRGTRRFSLTCLC